MTSSLRFFGVWSTLTLLILLVPTVSKAHETGEVHAHPGEPSITVVSEPVDVLVDPTTGRPIGNPDQKPIDPKQKPGMLPGAKPMDTKMRPDGQKLNPNTGLKPELKEKRDSMKENVLDAKENMLEKRTEAAEKLRERVHNATTTLKDRAQAAKQRIDDKKGEMVQKAFDKAKAFLARVLKQMSAAHDRLVKLVERTEARMLKLEEAGATMTDAETQLAVVKTELTEARAAIDAFGSALENTPALSEEATAEEARTSYQSLKTLASAGHQALRDVREAIRVLIDAIKAGAETLPASTDATEALEN